MSQLPRLFWSPCYQQVQAWVIFLCEKGGIDGNKQLRLVGQVLQVAYGKVLGIFPIPLPPRCQRWLTLSSADFILDSIHTRNANAMPTGVQRWLVRLTIRSLSKLGWHSNLKSDAKQDFLFHFDEDFSYCNSFSCIFLRYNTSPPNETSCIMHHSYL